MGKLLNWVGQDITPGPPTLQEKFEQDLLDMLISQTPINIITEELFKKFKIHDKD